MKESVLKGKRILAVDDELDVLSTLQDGSTKQFSLF